jgi:protein TonB
MTARTLTWFEDDDPRDFARWSTAAAIVVFAHAALIGGYLLWHPPAEEIGDETSAIAIELTAQDIEHQAQPEVVNPPPQQQITSPDAMLPEEKPPEKVVPPTPETRTAAPTVAAAPRVDPSWQALLVKHLQRFKNYPSGARERKEEGEVLLAFIIDRNGHVLSRHIVKGSGHPDLDNEALALVERAQPLPAFPASMTQAQLPFTAPIVFALQ